MAFMDQSHLQRCQREDEVESESPVTKRMRVQWGDVSGKPTTNSVNSVGSGVSLMLVWEGGKKEHVPAAPGYIAPTPV